MIKKFDNNLNNEYILTEEGNLQSREVAYKYIYKKNRDKYSKLFGFYIVHHIDGDTFNNSVKNLYICSRNEHKWIHSEQRKDRKKFKNSRDIDIFLINKKAEGDAKLFSEDQEIIESSDDSQPRIKVNFKTETYSDEGYGEFRKKDSKKIEKKILRRK